MGIFNRDSRVTLLPGVGYKSYLKFEENGVTRMSDLKKHADWFNMKTKNEHGHMEYILDKDDRKKAKEAADKYFESVK